MSTLSTATTTALKDAARAAAVVLVVLGAVPALAQAAGLFHITMPAAVLGYAAVATTVVTGFLSWAKAHGLVAKAAAKLGL